MAAKEVNPAESKTRQSLNHSLKTGLCFGLTSGTITTLGLMVGLHSGTHSKLIVLGGILTIAVADAFSDALGIHISEESENIHTRGEVWQSTMYTFATKFLFALTFMIPVLLMELTNAIIVSVIWGLAVLSVLSYVIARSAKENAWKVIAEHLIVALVVITMTHYFGDIIAAKLG
jgi:VIT1/CCC1 family predicted Fe2+/Mn2+ transporter